MPPGVEIAGQWSWRILVIAGVAVLIGLIVIQLQLIVIPFLIAILVAALLQPAVHFLVAHRWPKWIAVTLMMLATLGAVTGLVVLVVGEVRSGFPDLQERTVEAYENFKNFISGPPFNINNTEFNTLIADGWEAVQTDTEALVSGALSVGSTAGHVLAGALLALFATIFILIDGSGIWHWVVRLFPRRARRAVDSSGRAGWVTLTTFVKVQIFVAAVDAIGIGLFAFFLQLPLTIPIAIAVFLGSFIPVVGAVATGTLAVFIALIYSGPGPALIMLIGVLAVQQIEGHILQPLVMGSAVKVHPLAVVFAVAAGGFIAGIPGALFAVPLVAVVNVMVTHIARGEWRTTALPLLEDVVKKV